MTAKLAEDDLDRLERRLTLDISKLEPGAFRSTEELIDGLVSLRLAAQLTRRSTDGDD